MKILIITQKVDANDDLLGFFISWLREISKKVEKVYVISLLVRQYDLPANVEVYSLGKEAGKNKLFRYFRFYKLLFKILSKADKVLAHMCPEYINALWPVNVFYKKELYLWYTHRKVSSNLRLACNFVKKIFTASGESCQLNSDKVKILGHGIDLEKYQINSKLKAENLKLNIIYVARISKIKNQELLIRAINVLVKEKNFTDFKVKFIGAPIMPTDKLYLAKLQKLIGEFNIKEYVEFTGKVSNKDIIKYYQEADLSLNLSPTGGLDKTVLESIACGLSVIVANQGFQETLGEYANKLIINEDESQLAEKILELNDVKNEEMRNYLREQINKYHNQNNLINNLISEMR